MVSVVLDSKTRLWFTGFMEILAREIREGDALVEFGTVTSEPVMFSDVFRQEERVELQSGRFLIVLPASEYVQVKP